MESSVIVGIILVIIIIILYRRETASKRSLGCADAKIQKLSEEIAAINSGICSNETDLGKCRGDLSSCEGKSHAAETELAALSAELAELREKLASAETDLQHQSILSFELKRALDNAPCGFGLVKPYHHDSERVYRLVEEQEHLIKRLRVQLVDQRGRVLSLLRRQNMYAGMY
jgi:chromosome segregation ATPase